MAHGIVQKKEGDIIIIAIAIARTKDGDMETIESVTDVTEHVRSEYVLKRTKVIYCLCLS